ncbi:hypothetical protein T07_9220 [Trichinella nelsoni]|uniref:Uncharacterized protein n=1 Tax=Trichinella nelsoni TaxID=6336 RepID=A0A0V0RI33_9BILA|nr:hypothetical protein T07_9220 [Trichinella nelsoni]
MAKIHCHTMLVISDLVCFEICYLTHCGIENFHPKHNKYYWSRPLLLNGHVSALYLQCSN